MIWFLNYVIFWNLGSTIKNNKNNLRKMLNVPVQDYTILWLRKNLRNRI